MGDTLVFCFLRPRNCDSEMTQKKPGLGWPPLNSALDVFNNWAYNINIIDLIRKKIDINTERNRNQQRYIHYKKWGEMI